MKKCYSIIWGLIGVLSLSACTHYTSPLNPEEQRQSDICRTEAFLTPDGSLSHSYLDFCVHNFAQRDAKLTELLKTAGSFQICAQKLEAGLSINPLVTKAIKERRIDCKKEQAKVDNIRREEEKEERAENRKREREWAIQQKRNSNPALYYCLDSGFKQGTQAMATCIASWNEQRQQQAQQQQIQEQQREMQQQQNNAALMQMGAQLLAPPQPMQPMQPMPTTTDCHSDSRGDMHCTTW